MNSKYSTVAFSLASLALISLAACNQSSGGGGTPVAKAATSPLPFPGSPKPMKNQHPEDSYDFNDDDKDAATNPGTNAAKVAADGLVNSLTSKMLKINDVSTTVKINNLKAAQDIKSIETSIDDGVNVNLIAMKADGSSIQMGGPLSDQAAMMSSQDTKVSSFGVLKCLDKDGAANKSCRIASMDLMQDAGKTEVMAVIRHTNAQLQVNDEQVPTVPSEDYKNLRAMFVASAAGSTTGSVIKTIFFDSSEVVNGETFVRISMVTNDNEVIGLKGNLKVPTKLKFTEGSLVKDVRPQAVKSMIRNFSDIKSGWQAFVQSAQILRVDSASEFTLLIDVQGTQAEPRQTISLKLKRENPAVIDLN